MVIFGSTVPLFLGVKVTILIHTPHPRKFPGSVADIHFVNCYLLSLILMKTAMQLSEITTFFGKIYCMTIGRAFVQTLSDLRRVYTVCKNII